MRHFVGGAALGFVVFWFCSDKDKLDTQPRAYFIALGLMSLLGGLAAWGLR